MAVALGSYAAFRIGTITYSVSVIVGAMAKGQLNQWLFFVSWGLWEVSALGTYGLFFIRVHAVYQGSRMARWTFGLIYASIVLFPIFFMLGIRHSRTPSTCCVYSALLTYCLNSFGNRHVQILRDACAVL